MKNRLDRLKKISLKEIWDNEAQDFTPWLAEERNLELLSETIRTPLELEAQEKNVGHLGRIFYVKTRKMILGY